MPSPIYGPTSTCSSSSSSSSSPSSQASGTQTLAFMKQATGILTDLKAAGPQGKTTAVSRLVVLTQMIDLKLAGLR